MERNLLVIGASAVALNVIDIAHELGRKIEVLVDETREAGSRLMPSDIPIDNTLDPWLEHDHLDVIVAIGDNFFRESVYERLRPRVGGDRFVTLVHPHATVSHLATVGLGSIILAGSRVGANVTIGKFAYLTANTAVSHDCVLGDFVSMSPGATLGGRVTVGARTAFGMNSSVRERGNVGDDVVVGANTYANVDIPSNRVVVGVPGRVLRHRESGDRYLR